MAATGTPAPVLPALLRGCADDQAIVKRVRDLRIAGKLTWKDDYSAVLQTLAERALWRDACTLLLEMRFRAMKPFPPSYALVASACSRASHHEEAARVVNSLWEAQPMDLIGCGAVLSRFATSGLWEQALAFLERMPSERVAPDTYAYNNALVAGRKAGMALPTSQLFAEMAEQELQPDSYTYSLAIDSEKDAGRWEMALSRFRSMQESSIQGNTVVYSAAINACQLGVQPYFALKLLEDMKERDIARDVQVYTETIGTFGTASLWEHAVDLLAHMRADGIVPNSYSYTVALSACQRAMQWEEALRLFHEMRQEKLAPNVMTYNMLLSACARTSEKSMTERLVVRMKQDGVLPDEVTFNCLASLPSSAKERDGFISKLRSMNVKPDVRTYNPMISACAETGGWQDALTILADMPAAGVTPDLQSYNRFLSVCAATGSSDLVLQQLAALVKRGFTPDVFSFNTCIGACATAGEWQQAVLLLLRMESAGPTPDVVSYNSMIHACRKERPEWALAFPERMRVLGVTPDVITYNSVMQACGEANLWEHVLSGLVDMEHQGIIPTLDSYQIAIEKLVSAGQMAQALELVQSLHSRGQQLDQGCYSVLILGALRAGSIEWAEHLGRKAQEVGAFPRGRMNVLDLHAMTTPVARFFVLLELRDRALSQCKEGLTIVTGVGRHAEDRGAEATINPLVVALLKELQISVRWAQHGGSVKVPSQQLTPELARRIQPFLSAEALQRDYAGWSMDDVVTSAVLDLRSA